MVFPRIFGSIEVEERRPRSWNEPRRKRLSFVRDHHRSSSDEWALVPQQGGRRYYRNDAETWDLRKFEAMDRFNKQEHERRMLPYMHPPHQGRSPMMIEQGRGRFGGGGGQHHMPPRIEYREPRHRREDPDEIIGVVDGSDDSDDFDDDHHHHHYRPRHEPLSIDKDRDHSPSLPPGVTMLRRGESKKRGKSKGRGRGRGKSKPRHGHFDESDSSDSDGEFVEGFVLGRKASLRRGSPAMSMSPRRHRYERGFEDDSDDSLDLRRRRRSKSRGRRY